MPKDKLTNLDVKNAGPRPKTYRLSDGGGLVLEVRPNGARYWRLRFRLGGVERLKALGVYPAVSLKAAREAREEAKKLIGAGVDPVHHKLSGQTFSEIAEDWSATIKREGRSEAVILRAKRLIRYAKPIAHKHIGDITRPELRDVIKSLEQVGKFATAKKLAGAIRAIIQHGIDDSGQDLVNPALGLTVKSGPPEKHLAALRDAAEIGGLMRRIAVYESPVVRAALLFTAYTAARHGEVRGMLWSEVDLVSEIWIVPKGKTKQRKQHTVYLSRQATTILREMRKISEGERVFPGARKGRPMSENALSLALRAMGYTGDQMTVHGLRTIFSTLANESGQWRPEVIEHSLGHSEPDSVRAAYNQAQYADERRRLMQWYGDQLDLLAT